VAGRNFRPCRRGHPPTQPEQRNRPEQVNLPVVDRSVVEKSAHRMALRTDAVPRTVRRPTPHGPDTRVALLLRAAAIAQAATADRLDRRST
jgi:hypothetical protein